MNDATGVTTEKVGLTAERETALITLVGKARQSASADPILPDPWAEAAVERVDYDFAKLKVRDYESRIIAIRSTEFDALARSFIAEHPDAIVLGLGCGLDSRVFRVDPPATVAWVDIDFADVVDLRRRLFPEREGYSMVGAPVGEPGWLDSVPTDRPVMALAEGLSMYLDEPTMRRLLNDITGRFPSGRIAFDAWSTMSLRGAQRRGIKGTGASFGWAIDDPASIRALDEHLVLEREISATDLVAFRRMPAWSRVVSRLMSPIASLRRANRILVYRFGRPTP